MAAADVQAEIIDPMQRLFLPPKAMPDHQIADALREYVDALQGHKATVLRDAWRRVRDTHETRAWPSVGAFAKAARAASMDAPKPNGEERDYPLHRHDDTGWRGFFKRRWEAFRFSAIARQAAMEGWSHTLKCAVLDGLPPEQVSVAQFQAKHHRALRLLRAIEADKDFPNRSVALAMHGHTQASESRTKFEIETLRGPPPQMPPHPGLDFPKPLVCMNDPPEYQLRRNGL